MQNMFLYYSHLSINWLYSSVISTAIPAWTNLAMSAPGGVGQDHMHCHFAWYNAKSFYCFSLWEKVLQCILKSFLHAKTVSDPWIEYRLLYYMPLVSGYVCDHTASLRISDLSTTLKCLASSKKSIEQLIPIDPSKPQYIYIYIYIYIYTRVT